MADQSDISQRKLDHIRICLDESSQFDRVATGLDAFQFVNCALPELAPSDVDLTTPFLGKQLKAPIFVSSMTGGPKDGAKINQNLAKGTQKLGLGMGVGSQRIAIENPTSAASFHVRDIAPDIALIANLGAVQLNCGYSISEARKAVEMIGADGLFLHLNALQELVQPNGDTDFRGLMRKIEALIKEAEFPVLVKECGCGISGKLAKQLFELGVYAVDVSGAGGTSWSRVESERAGDSSSQRLGRTFANWGIPTARAIMDVRAQSPNGVIIASGGIRTGLDVAKAIALGADLVSVAKPILSSALESGDAVHSELEQFVEELRAACFLTGSSSASGLRDPEKLIRIK
ncbi:MAG: type 2 isopentenyl-diphosphate Delta-isomerase [Myxococcota bacterium]|nr:type 2 isopentenyl-diphosphate Delta-isomerase [Myxococcota bacterium]